MMRELAHMIHKRKVYPVICNTERHMIYDEAADLERILSLPKAVYQVCWNVMADRAFSLRIIRLYREGKEIFFGTNAHSSDARSLNMRYIESCIVKSYGESLYKRLQLKTKAFYEPALP